MLGSDHRRYVPKMFTVHIVDKGKPLYDSWQYEADRAYIAS